MISAVTKANAVKELNLWLKQNRYSESRQVKGNLYIANSTENGNIAIVMINRESNQPSVNCVKRTNFENHISQSKSLRCTSLYYVMYLPGNRLHVIIPDTAADSFFSDLTKDWYTLSMNRIDFEKHRRKNIIIREL